MYGYNEPYYAFSGITPEEVAFLQQATAELDENQKNRFFAIYSTKRKNPQDILLVSLLGFVGFAGIHRFMLNQIGMGLLYFFTAGLCFIGTIVDLVNHKNLANEYNKQMAYESFHIAKMYQ
ncbi:TM2 domain-containing protein [Mucilaginibacter limnophilus]|uniref:TM2 domain-containing protein n=1 Tax=Mucilaginibacter limnophilus TaxID=1932778 RepID=A0A3S2ULT5_9SPHI|nr:TM2 domain-containing protein [Mucilaginibacter limnophilus]RVU01422.1 TM2 domain-containing protein [Mucilaginibacter limnophilus]